ncbi:nitrile hydratase subunit beta [Paroceanicella profunda]|uniref:Nitrile hydratase subunit beta n=1 Tax=Paroceanicella profunda TaxID=2579971 RepID=A0A5B8FI93_9RHOB|nr:SH3-like domain-containing protein [Paroceanicella profunda]QDL92848.1 nitrile hydratase subunit beta [Paroceanicella profunda]
MPETAVRVKTWPSHGLHVRTPRYLRGKCGVIERDLGSFPNPEELAYGLPGTPPRRLVRVRFTMAEVWGAAAENPADTLDAEIYEHWLEPVEG